MQLMVCTNYKIISSLNIFHERFFTLQKSTMIFLIFNEKQMMVSYVKQHDQPKHLKVLQ